ncbi:helix-turn-helix domain-containing protein [Acidiferrimicrobium sp. IK]|uniref:helix-turn-helix domain-containing protein n=1 Tax=Acidiferrimicrobium sp. IK TaxID=2871700 RepID=UPI0021CAE643|nr:helix-turn-helix domain-containing protein [Acidiferrimicrobium sp. IK]
MQADTHESTTEHAEIIADLLASQDAPAVFERLGRLRSAEGPAEVIGATLLPAARLLQRRYRAGELDAAALSAGIALARRALIRAGEPAVAPPAGVTRRPVVVAAPSATTSLDADGAYESLLATGHPAQLIAPVDDVESLARHLRSLAPLALVLACDDARSLPAIAALAATAGAVGVPVLACGPAYGADGHRAARIGATAWAPDPAGMLTMLARWHQAGGALAMNVEEPQDAALVRAAWPAVTMAAAGTGGPDEAWAQTTVRAVGDLLAASLWAGDVTVLLDWLDDELSGPDRTQVRDVHVVGLLDAVSSALPSTMSTAATMIGEARDHLRQHILRPGRPTRPAPRAALPETAAPSPVDSRPADAGARPSLAPLPAPVPPAAPSMLSNGHSAAGQAAAGQAFADLLLLGALAAQSTGAVLAVVQPGGKWSALAHGLDQRDGLNDPLLWTTIASRREAVEIPDMGTHPELSRGPLAQRPMSLRWAYGIALRDQDGAVIAVFSLVDRWLRQVTRREQRALTAAARQLTVQLLQVRRPAPAAAPPAAPTGWSGVRPLERPAGGGRRNLSLPDGQQLLRSHEVAVLFDVTERTVINWAAAGKLPSLRTIGGHLRFRSEDVYSLLSSRQGGA